MTAPRPDPSSVTDRAELAAGLRSLRLEAGATVREIVDRSGGLHGTISGWFSGLHVPTKSSAAMFAAVLLACGVTDESERDRWWEAVARARAASGRRVADRSKAAASDRGPAPYKGLETFELADADWFFGRSEVTERLRRRVRDSRDAGGGLVFVVGASGSGKSSLLRAGLAPAFESVRIGSGVRDLREFLNENVAPPPGAVLVFDQAEELWTLATPAERREFLAAAGALLGDTDAVLVLGLRADFFADAASEDALLPGLSDNPVVVGRMTEEQLRQVITLPAAKAGITVEDALVQVLIGELGPRGSRFAHDSGTLPLLSHALLTTWQTATGPTLTVADYLATGGIGGAVEQSAEEVYGRFTPDQQREARRIFMRMVNLDDDVVTRRRVDRSELFRGDEAAGAVDDVDTVIESFAVRRLLTIDEDSVQVTHEALLTAWQRLREWLDEDRQWLVEHRRLTQAAELWDDSARDDGALLTPSRLTLVQEGLGADRDGHLNSIEREYVHASVIRRDREIGTERRRRRVLEILVASLATLTVLAITLSVTAFVARSDANTRRVDAERAESEAVSRQIAGVAQNLRTQDPGLAAYFALASYEVNETSEARSALLDASAIHAPVRLPGPEGNAVTGVDASGKLVATAGSDGRVRLWALGDDSLPQVGELTMPSAGDAGVLTFAPRGDVVAVGGLSGWTLWNVADPADPTLLFSSDGAEVMTLSFAPSGSELVVGTAEKGIERFDISDPTRPRPIGAIDQPGVANATEFSPDGRYFVAVAAGRAMRIWDTSRFDVPVLDVPTDGSTYTYLQLAFSPDSRMLISGTTGREVLRWRVDPTGRLSALPTLDGFTSYVNDVAFSSDGTRIAAGSSDNSSQIWEAESGRPVMTLPGPTLVTSIAFGPDASSIVTAGADGITRVWPLPGPVLTGAGDTVFTDPVDESGQRLLSGTGSRGDGLMLWDVSDPDSAVSTDRLRIADGDVQTGASAMTADGSLAAGGTASGGFQLWAIDDAGAATQYGGVTPAVSSLTASLAFGRSGTLLAVAGQSSNDVVLFSVDNPAAPRKLAQFDAGSAPGALALSPDERTLAVPTVAGAVELWDISEPSNPRPTVTLAGFGSDAQAATFSPDGSTLAAGSADRSVRLWDMSDPAAPRHLARIVGPSSAIYSVRFDRSGTRLVSGVGGQALWIWDVTDRSAPRQYATLTAYGTRTYDGAFGTGDAVVFASGTARNVRVWRTDPDEIHDRMCAHRASTITEAEWAQYLPGVQFRQLCTE